MEEQNDLPEVDGAENIQDEEEQKVSGPLGTLFAPKPAVWNEARRMTTDKNVRVEDLAFCCAQDPVLVIELLKMANAMFFSVGRAPITSVKVAIVRLGSETVLKLFDKLTDREQVEDEDIRHWVEMHRSRCVRTSIIARMFAESIARTLSDDAQAAGLLMHVGEMIAAHHFGQTYIELAEEHKRSGVNYRLANDHSFDVEKMGCAYLRRNGIPEALLFVLDREATSRDKERTILRPLVAAACELVDAFDNNRWEKLAPGKKLSSKSSVRLLQLSDSQYLKIYERASEYLFAARLKEEKEKQEELNMSFAAEPPMPVELNSAQEALQDEIFDLLGGESEEEFYDEEAGVTDIGSKSFESEEEPAETEIEEIEEDLIDPADEFNLSAQSRAKKKKSVPRVEKAAEPVAAPELATSGKGTAIVADLADVIENASSSEEVISNILSKLVDGGPFEKTALIVVSRDRTNAIVVASRGPSMGNGVKIELHDPLSPLAQCFSKVQSFGNKKNEASPFGSKAFALSPIDADHDTPVALYADCGEDGAITFEARRVFRTVVDILNKRLPTLPGGIPVELS